MKSLSLSLLLLVIVPACSQGDTDRPESTRIRVDVGGHELEFLIEGTDQSRPVVVLESGLGGRIDDWEPVRQRLSRHTRVVSYHRAGSGGSQPGPRPRSARQVATELRAALQSLNITPPYILVGHSIGGLYVRTYAGLYPHEISGIVLADPTLEFGETMSMEEINFRLQQSWGAQHRRIEKLFDRIHPRMAVIAAHSMLEFEPYILSRPESEQQTARKRWLEHFESHAHRIEGLLGLLSDADRQEMFASMESMRIVRDLPTTQAPVMLLVAGGADADRGSDRRANETTMSADYLAWSSTIRLRRYSEFFETIPEGEMQILEGTGHNIPADRPEAIVNAVSQWLQIGIGPKADLPGDTAKP